MPLKKLISPITKKFGQAPKNQRKIIFDNANSIARDAGNRGLARPRIGERGVSGPRGSLIKREMALRVRSVADLGGVNSELASRLIRIYDKAHRGELNVDAFPRGHEALVRIMNKIVAAESSKRSKGPVKLTPMEQKAINYWARFA